MSRDSGSRLGRLGVLAPAALSACLDASVLAVPAAGAIVSTVLKELSKAFMLKKWFHGMMSAKEAEHLIMEKGKNGSFLVRESVTRPGEYVLSVRVRGRVTHVMIRRQDNKYDVGSGEQFEDLVGLIEHFRSFPMVETSGDVLRLLQPVSGTALRANDIRRKVNEMQKMERCPVMENLYSFDGEFQSLKMLEHRNTFPTTEGSRPENETKNRYRNILPYDKTRVVLRRREQRFGGDYINASFVLPQQMSASVSNVNSDGSTDSIDSVHSLILRGEGHKIGGHRLVTTSLSDDALKEVRRRMKLDRINGNFRDKNIVKDKEYIATQGCLPNTVDDFWWMVWQEDVRVIVMITNEYERGKKKCERYWPAPGLENRYDEVSVKTSTESCPDAGYLRRDFTLTHGDCSRTVFQYQFKAWPDHGTPTDPAGVLAYIEDINKKLAQIADSDNPPEKSVLCVHCSAGVGRTGTFIVLDMLIDQIKACGVECDIDVFGTVEQIRSQRGGMVQNRAQYRFIYLALREYIESQNTSIRKKVYLSDA